MYCCCSSCYFASQVMSLICTSISLCCLSTHLVFSCRASFVAIFVCLYAARRSIALCCLACFWGAATAVSRAIMGRHYIGDICAGIPLGILTIAIVTQVCSNMCLQQSFSKHNRHRIRIHIEVVSLLVGTVSSQWLPVRPKTVPRPL